MRQNKNAGDHDAGRPPRGGRGLKFEAGREGGDNVISTLAPAVGISIHAPREGGDHRPPRLEFFYVFISIHAPREGGDMGLATTSMAGT